VSKAVLSGLDLSGRIIRAKSILRDISTEYYNKMHALVSAVSSVIKCVPSLYPLSICPARGRRRFPGAAKED
jgi:hypothetical protein